MHVKAIKKRTFYRKKNFFFHLYWKRLVEPLKKDETENSTIPSLRILKEYLYLNAK